MNRDLALVFLWTVLGAALRVFRIGSQSLWLDELFSVFVSRRDFAQMIVGTAQGDTNPPLFNLLLHLALQFGSDETAARAVSALFSIATIPLFYFLAKRLFDSVQSANVAAALLATSPFQIAYAQEARMYAQWAFFQLAAIYFFQRAWVDGKRSDGLAFVLVETLAFYSHSLAVLSLVALDVFALWRWRELGARWRGLVAAHGLIALLFAPWMLVLAQQTSRVLQGFWNPSSTLVRLLRTVYVLNFNTALPIALVPLGLTVTLLLFALGLYAVVRALILEPRAPNERQALQLALTITVVPPALLLVASVIRPLYIERVLISSSFGLFLIWAWAWTQRPRWLDRIAIAMGALLLVVALGSYYFDPQVQKPPMREAAQMFASRWQPGDVVVHTSDWAALAFNYYLPAIPQHFLAGDPIYVDETTRGRSGLIAGLVPEEREAVVKGNSRIWLVVALEHSESYQWKRVEEFDALYTPADIIEVSRIYLFLYRVKE